MPANRTPVCWRQIELISWRPPCCWTTCPIQNLHYCLVASGICCALWSLPLFGCWPDWVISQETRARLVSRRIRYIATSRWDEFITSKIDTCSFQKLDFGRESTKFVIFIVVVDVSSWHRVYNACGQDFITRWHLDNYAGIRVNFLYCPAQCARTFLWTSKSKRKQKLKFVQM